MSGTRCADCGLVNFGSSTHCRRCSHDLSLPASGLNSNAPRQAGQHGPSTGVSDYGSQVGTIWAIASVCAFISSGVGFTMYAGFATSPGNQGSITGAIVASMIAAAVPLLGAQLVISDIQKRNRPKQVKRKPAPVPSRFGITPLELPTGLKVLRTVIVLAVTITAVVYSGDLIEQLPAGRYKVGALALPAIAAGLITLLIVDKALARFRK